MPAGGGLIESRLLPSPERIWMVLVQEVAGGVFLALADLVLACDHPQTEGERTGRLVYHAAVTFSRALILAQQQQQRDRIPTAVPKNRNMLQYSTPFGESAS